MRTWNEVSANRWELCEADNPVDSVGLVKPQADGKWFWHHYRGQAKGRASSFESAKAEIEQREKR